jgi:hypothetical protein
LEWDTYPNDECRGCASQNFCHKKICAAFPDTSTAHSYASVCHLMKELTKRKQLLTVYIGLGDCASLLNPTGIFLTQSKYK